MRKKIFNIFVVMISIFVLIELLVRKSLIYASVIDALNLWTDNLIPALFPFFIISDILINYNITNYIPKFIKKICKVIFNITDNMLTVLLLSMISGFPSNARNTRTLYDVGMISLEEANHILIFSHFANPVFVLTIVGIFFLHSEKLGIILLLSHYISNFLLGIFFRNKFKHNSNLCSSLNNTENFGNIFIVSIKKAIDTTLMICGIIVTFSMLAAILINIANLSNYNEMIVKGLFEITIGVRALSNLDISIRYKLVIVSCFLAFGGISVHVQVLSQIVNTKIKYIYFLIGRMYQLIISGVFTYAICLILNI